MQQDVHENAFFFDEKNKVIYISFKYISTIIKLKYPEGIVLNTYGPMQNHNGNWTQGRIYSAINIVATSQKMDFYMCLITICAILLLLKSLCFRSLLTIKAH